MDKESENKGRVKRRPRAEWEDATAEEEGELRRHERRLRSSQARTWDGCAIHSELGVQPRYRPLKNFCVRFQVQDGEGNEITVADL